MAKEHLAYYGKIKKNQSTDSTEGQEIEDMRQHKRSDKVNLNIRPSAVTLTLGISN